MARPRHWHRATGAALLTVLLALPLEGQEASRRGDQALDTLASLELFGTVVDLIRDEFVDAPDEQALVRAALQGMLTSLDPHSDYLPPAAYTDMREGMSGEYAGVGLQTQMREGRLVVMSAFEGTPAERAGIRAGDIIVAVDGIDIAGQSHDEAVGRMRGPVGSAVSITVRRDGEAAPVEFTMERATIATPAVRWSMEGDVALLQLTTFSAQAASGIRQAIERIYSQRAGMAPEGIVLDLRNNRGGLVDQAVLVADIFLAHGAVVLIRGRGPEDGARFDARPDAMDAMLADIPLVVLINGASASAAEIVAGALQDHRRATLVGTRSFGKGSVQSIISLGSNGAMRMTTSRYYTPSNRSIQALGIVPDIEVQQVVPPELAGLDIVAGEAALAGHLTIAGQESAISGSSAYVPSAKEDDAQLQFALRLIEEGRVAASPSLSRVGGGF